jgi:hypothetical protein
MNLTFDRNLFTQTTLDSGALTMLGGVTHCLLEPGQYRGIVFRESEDIAAFYIDADKNCAVAQANIDLASLDPAVVVSPRQAKSAVSGDCGCGPGASPGGTTKFIVHPKGYLVFHVSAGAGGYSVIVRKAEEDPKTNLFDTRKLSEGDVFSCAIIRPGQYSIENTVTKAGARITVLYPKVGKTGYRPPKPITFECGSRGMEPQQAEVQPGQGIHFRFKAPSRIKIDLLKPDDGPGKPLGPKNLGQRLVAVTKKQ